MPCPFTGPKMFCASPNCLSQPNNLFTYCANHKHFVPQTKRGIAFSKIGFCAGTKVFVLAQKIWTGTKHFGTCKRTRHTYYMIEDKSLLSQYIYCAYLGPKIKLRMFPQFCQNIHFFNCFRLNRDYIVA